MVVQIFTQAYNNFVNRQRIIKLIEILRRHTDADHRLTIRQISELLEAEGINISSRKTLYDDFKTLSSYGYEIEYDDGYYLSEAPFTLSEIKIITDSINSLKNLDDRFLDSLKKKLYSFVSVYEEKDLKKLEYRNRHSDKKFINRLEDTLNAIRSNETLFITRNGKEKEEIVPLFLYRNNDYYYLYYHYPNHQKIYHTRFDNIIRMNKGSKNTDNDYPLSRIIEHINESSNAFYGEKSKLISFLIIEDDEYLRQRLADDFPNLIFTKDGFTIRASISDAFFGKLSSYKDKIKISDPQVAEAYIHYLEKIITRNR